MRFTIWTLAGLLAFALFGLLTIARSEDRTSARVKEQRQRLAGLKAGADSSEVLKILGRPDEVRHVQKGYLVDGTRHEGGNPDLPQLGSEAERWAYGVLGHGMFAAVGYVSLDQNGKVVAAIPSDFFCRPEAKPPHLISSATEQAVETPSRLICHLGPVEFASGRGEIADSLKTTVTLKNNGGEEFRLQHDAARSIRRFLIVEVYDSKRSLLWRDDEMSYHSPISTDHNRWPVLAISAGKSKSEEGVRFSPASGFGRLPAGTYFMRVYFPFTEGKYYPSNLVHFNVPGTEKANLELPQNRRSADKSGG